MTILPLFRRLLLLSVYLGICCEGLAGTVFQDGFENGSLGPVWSSSRVGDGRTSVTSDYGPATGSKHLVFDDSVNDAIYSTAEVTLGLNLTGKINVVLSFKAKSLGNEAHIPPSGNTTSRNYDGVAVSTNGGVTWRSVASLASVGGSWESITVTLDSAVSALGGGFNSDFRIRFSGYDNASAPIDGIAIDDIQITADDDQRVLLELPNIVDEGSGPHTAYLFLALPSATPLTVTLASAPGGQITAPAAVEIPAGETFLSFEFSIPDDAVVNLTRTASITPSAPNAQGSGATITIRDNEAPPVASLSIPSNLTEGLAASNATVALSFAVPVPVTFTLSSNPSGEITFPATVVVPAGQTEATFGLAAVNDTKLDGSILVSMTAAAPGLLPVTSQTTAVDNEVPALSITLPGSITEGTVGTGTLTLSGAVQNPITVNLTSSNVGTLTVPSSVTIPAGQTTAEFQITAVNDSAVNLIRNVTVTPGGTGFTGSSAATSVTDDEAAPVITLTLPANLTEGETPSNNGIVNLSSSAAVAVTVSFSANPGSDITLPASVSIPSGQTQATFTARATNDTRIDGNVGVVVTAAAPGVVSGNAQVLTVDNETRNLTLTVPSTIQESANANCTVSISGTLTAPLQVTLASNSPESLSVPATITINAGQTQATFVASATDNGVRDGTRGVTVTASAGTFTLAVRSCTVRDNDVAGYRFGTITDLVNVYAPLNITINAVDVEGNVMSGFTGSVNLSIVLPDGSAQSLSPAVATLSGSGWTGNITFPAVSEQALKLRAADEGGYSGDSTSFDAIHTLNVVAADLIWDGPRNRVYASVPATAGAPHANKVLAIDPETLAITGSLVMSQDPGRLALTNGGEYLYVALNANGTVAKVNPSTMSVLSTFAVGTDPTYGTLYVGDMCTVEGQPNVVVISQYRKSVSPSHNGVAAYDNGVIRPGKTQDHTGSDIIEPSADPTIFFGYNTGSSEFGFRRLKLSSTGMSQLDVKQDLFEGYSIDMRSAGDRVYSTSGIGVDGQLLRRAGTFNVSGLVYPESGSGRVFYVESAGSFYNSFDKISAHDAASFSLIRRLTMPPMAGAKSLIRWGANGMAFRTETFIAFLESSRLVPSDPPADLRLTLQAAPNPVFVGQPLTYTAQITNDGPNVARNISALATLGDNQTIQSASGSAGVSGVSGNQINLVIPELAVGASATLTVTAIPQSAGSLTCIASVTSDAIDPQFSNNVASKLISVGFETAVGVVNALRLPASEILYDPTRNLIWATLPDTVPAPLGRSVVSIDPQSGLMSDPISINANPYPQSMALSANGRYLYVGLSDLPEVHRIDLTTSPYTSVRIPLGSSQWGSINYAQDIEVLPGDGTSFLIAGSNDHAAAVYDNTVRRTNRTEIYSVDRIERTATNNVFVGYNNYTSGFQTSRLAVSASGVATSSSVGNLISGYYTEIRGAGNLLLSSSGHLVDSSNLTLKANLGVVGRPCVDSSYQRAFVVNGNALRSFSANDGSSTGILPLPTTSTGDWAKTCIRWGLDGFAILGGDSKIYVTRWPAAMPATLDQNADGFGDMWAATHFGSLQVDPNGDSDGDGVRNGLEYFFGTSPLLPTKAPMTLRTSSSSGATILHLTYSRRAGIPSNRYGYVVSESCKTWTPAQEFSETVLSTQTLNGETIELIEVAFPFASSQCGFVRLKWVEP